MAKPSAVPVFLAYRIFMPKVINLILSRLANPFRSDPAEFRSPLTVEQFLKELQPQVGGFWGGKTVFNGSLSGKIVGSKVRLIVRKSWYHNSFELLFDGELEPILGGCRLHGRFRMRRFALIFMAIWLGFLLFGLISTLIKHLQQGDPAAFSVHNLILLNMLVFGYFLVFVGGLLGEYNRKLTQDFLREKLQAKPVEAP